MPNQANINHPDGGKLSNVPAVASETESTLAPANQSAKDVYTEKWKLKVQGVMVEFDQPVISTRVALEAASFDPSKSWHIFLIVQGKEKEELSLDSEIDLRTPGLEKIRLMQRNVDNGDAQCFAPRRVFKLLSSDSDYLDRLGLRWETIEVENRRWLLLHGYPIMSGYVPDMTTLALDIPADYPASQIDMFYFHPWVARADGATIPSIQIRATIEGLEYQGWSRHRNAANPWDSSSDSVRTHLVLVESCLTRELGQ